MPDSLSIEVYKKREDIIKALNKTLEIFISHNESSTDELMSNGIWPVAEALELDRVIIYRIHSINGEDRFSQKYRWEKNLGGTTPIDERMRIVPKSPVIPEWIKQFDKDESVDLRYSDMSEDEHNFLDKFAIKSILLIPVHTQGHLWGAVSFQDHTNERDFDELCYDLFRVAASLCAYAVIRSETRANADDALTALKKREKMSSTLNEAALLFLSQYEENFEETMTAGVKMIADLLDLDRISIWRNHDKENVLHVSQVYRWDRDSGGTTQPTQGLVDVPFADIAPRWEGLLGGGGEINSPICLLPERPFLQPLGVISMFITPIFINGGFWGAALFEDRIAERYFDEPSMEMMRSASFLCANIFIRVDMERKVKESLVRMTEASSAKSEFLSNMSHEMRTPLNAIIGMTNIGRKAPDISRKNYAIGRVKDASEHLLAVINDVLDMSKIEANKLELSMVEFCFEKMLQKVMTVIHFRVDEKSQNLSVNVDERVSSFFIGDDQRLAQVITNLLSNAVKFTPDGGDIGLNASLVSDEGGLCVIRIEVSDTGIGISEGQREKLFHAFGQAESGISRRFGGSGLGLVISKRIVEMMGGDISVVSELGKGSAFSFTVKMARSARPIKTLLSRGIDTGAMRVLVIDGEDAHLDYLKRVFSKLGIYCDAAHNCAEAAGSAGKYDMCFVSWRLSGTGCEKFVRSVNPYRSIVTVISVADWSMMRVESLRTGINKYLLLPMLTTAVIDCVNECCGDENAPDTESSIKPGAFAGKRALLAEDIEINREIMVSLLEDSGIEIDCAENGREAYEMVANAPNQYDLIFMDMQMPVMDGIEATRLIRAIPELKGKRLPILAMTANVFVEDIMSCIKAGMDDHLGKPLNIEELSHKLNIYLNRF